MNILHLFSNWKWTGPAEHALNLAANLKKAGHGVTFACAAPPEGVPDSLAEAAGRAGITPVTGFHLNKHFSIADNLSDISALVRFIKDNRFDIVHTHLGNDHLLAGMALRGAFIRTPLVRTCYDGDGLPAGFRTRLLLSLMTDGLITISDGTRNRIVKKRCLPPERIWKLEVPVDIRRFDPDAVQHNRPAYNLSGEAMVGGIVARVQRHRRFDVLLEALQIVFKEFPGLRFMIIGRGTHIEEIAVKPSQNMGIRTNLIFTGYKKEDFAQTLKCLNFKVFLMPGTDGSCRAVREAMALGIPVIAANRGMLPEIVENGVHGLVVDDTPENLAKAILFLVENPDLRLKMGARARKKARTLFDPERHTEAVAAIYRKVIERKRGKHRPVGPEKQC